MMKQPVWTVVCWDCVLSYFVCLFLLFLLSFYYEKVRAGTEKRATTCSRIQYR